jgi:hypothetical protein
MTNLFLSYFASNPYLRRNNLNINLTDLIGIVTNPIRFFEKYETSNSYKKKDLFIDKIK